MSRRSAMMILRLATFVALPFNVGCIGDVLEERDRAREQRRLQASPIRQHDETFSDPRVNYREFTYNQCKHVFWTNGPNFERWSSCDLFYAVYCHDVKIDNLRITMESLTLFDQKHNCDMLLRAATRYHDEQSFDEIAVIKNCFNVTRTSSVMYNKGLHDVAILVYDNKSLIYNGIIQLNVTPINVNHSR